MSTWLKRALLALSGSLLLVACAAWWLLAGSVPALEGTMTLRGLSAPVTIQRDARGVVTVEAATELDAVRALGFIHAQERFFEMDLMRRTAAGELAGLFGAVAIDADRKHRVHRMRARVERDLASIAGDRANVLQAYVDGINDGLAGLRVRPWPYLLLRTQPRPWRLADSPLVGYAMYFDLQDSTNRRELALRRISEVVPPALHALLARDGTRWDAPLQGRPRGDAALPDAATLDLRRLAMPDTPRALAGLVPPALETGSNNFAVSGSLTADGRAIVADDMHLGLRAPNIWFRARLRYADANAIGGKVDVSGFTLPGLPLVVVGSNGHVAWGFTNGYADVADWKVLPPACVAGSDPGPGCSPVTHHREHIEVAGGDGVDLDVEETAWGPAMERDAAGNLLALRWAAHLPGSLNLGLMRMATARDVQSVLDDDSIAIPAQNLVVVDSSGAIGWRILGPVPRRGDCRQHIAADSAQARPACAWRLGSALPAIAAPPAGRLWTANNRTLDGDALQTVGDGGYALGARARQIRDDLFARQQFTERDLLAIQLDDRAVFLRGWWQLLHAEATRSHSPALLALAGAARTWQGRASTDSTSYRIVRAWRLAVNARILDGLTAPAQAALGQRFLLPDLPQLEGVAWPLVTQRPTHLLPRRFGSWQALFEDAAAEVRDELETAGPLAQRTWGERNTARICHPLSAALPTSARGLLCMPFDQLSGDGNLPRVAGPDFGASERMVVSPGHEADGLVHMPGGQSGHPLSPYWGAGHEDWVHGRPTPFLPGTAEHTLRLVPAR